MTQDATPTPTTAALSLRDLRRHLIQRSSALSVRARNLRARGDVKGASRAAAESARLLHIAREMRADARSRSAATE
jgi:hypothetical protein